MGLSVASLASFCQISVYLFSFVAYFLGFSCCIACVIRIVFSSLSWYFPCSFLVSFSNGMEG